MSAPAPRPAVLTCSGVSKRFTAHKRSFLALQDVSFEAAPGAVTALVGSDGAGKTTLLRLIAGLLEPDQGRIEVLGLETPAHAQAIQARIGYMPQRFGLYEDLTVQENLDLYADLHAVPAAERARKHPRLMEMTALAPFTRRLAGRLSGGMKQKLGLACTLVSTPELLLLDEPTAGVDPLSRRELWRIIRDLVREEGLPVIVSTSYLDEADRCDEVIVLHRGRMLAQGAPDSVSTRAEGRTFLLTPQDGLRPRDIQARLLDQGAIVDAVPEGGRVRVVMGDDPARAAAAAGAQAERFQPTAPHFEDGFMMLLGAAMSADPALGQRAVAMRLARAPKNGSGDVEIAVRNLVRRFGAFTAVDNISFDVRRGEIFGLLGPNGAGKTTTFRMLCGLLAVTGGELSVGGADMRRARASARARIGYVAQKFSLYGPLTVRQNLDFFASVYGIRLLHRRERIRWALEQFELDEFAHVPSAQLAGGFKQRLAMAAALLHEPEILFLDEPTSGADPIARRDFWRRITALSEQGVTVIVTTHFMAEAEYCDRIAILDSGRILAQGPPAEIRARGRPEGGGEPDMEDAFIAIVEDSRAAQARDQGAAA